MDELMPGNYYGGQAMQGAPTPLGHVSLKTRLEMAVKEAEAKLADVKRARDIFEKNPDLEELLNIMQRGRF